MAKKLLRWVLMTAAALLLVLQAVPYGRAHSNPPVRQEPAWDSPQTRALAVRACFDCHSNQTAWPWYSHVAPASWLVQRDVDQGRAKMNFTEWDRPQPEAGESAEAVQEGKMPIPAYALLHPHARLSAAERESLLSGLATTFGGTQGREEHGEHDGGED